MNTSTNLILPPFLLFLVFLTLKLCDVISWPWLLVFTPIWGPILLFAIVQILVTALYPVIGRKTSNDRNSD